MTDEGGGALPMLHAKDFCTLANLWGGKPIQHDRVGETHKDIFARLSALFMIQPGVYRDFRHKRGKLLKESGLDARFLHSYLPPDEQTSVGSLSGQAGPAYEAYLARVTTLLDEMAGCVKTASGLRPVHFSWRAASFLEGCLNHYRRAMRDPRNRHCRDFLAKMPEHIARMAAKNHVFEGLDGDVGVSDVEGAEEIMRYHLGVYAWLHEPQPPAPSKAELQLLDDADSLRVWLSHGHGFSFSKKESRDVAARLCMTVGRLRKATERLRDEGIVQVVDSDGEVAIRLVRCAPRALAAWSPA